MRKRLASLRPFAEDDALTWRSSVDTGSSFNAFNSGAASGSSCGLAALPASAGVTAGAGPAPAAGGLQRFATGYCRNGFAHSPAKLRLRAVTQPLGTPLLQRLPCDVFGVAGGLVACGCSLLHAEAPLATGKGRGSGWQAAGAGGTELQPAALLRAAAGHAAVWALQSLIACTGVIVFLYVLNFVSDP